MTNLLSEEEFYDQYESFFLTLIGKSPYEYQKKVAYHLFQGKNVIIQAPTGSGKTLSVITPFLFTFMKQTDYKFADRLLYALPLRALVDSLSDEISLVVANSLSKSKPQIKVQTSSNRSDEYWKSDILFMTLDQLLAGYLTIPSGLSSRFDNLLAGAIPGSLIILDEFHLFDPERSMKTSFELIDRMKNLAQFIIMSATFSDNFIDKLSDNIGAVKISLTAKEVEKLSSHQKKERAYIVRETPLTSRFILEKHQKRTIAICNTVDRAQTLFRELKKIKNPKTKIFLLHSRFLTKDRESIENSIQKYFGKESERLDAILISTQVIEAGMNISADILHTELCPANSLIQRSGRCARYPPPRHKGIVYIHQLPLLPTGKPNYYPYVSQKEQVIETKKHLIKHSNDNFVYSHERTLINNVHTTEEDNFLLNLENISSIREEVEKVFETHHDGYRIELIRNILSTSVLVADEKVLKNNIKFIEKPFDTISINYFSLCNKLQKFHSDPSIDYLGAFPVFSKDTEEKYSFLDLITWKKTKNPEELISTGFCVLNPMIASYSSKEGLIFEKNNPPFLKTTIFNCIEGRQRPRYEYECESFLSHTVNVHRIFKKYLNNNNNGLLKLSKSLNISLDILSWYFQYSAVFHDFGKLQNKWQDPIQEWQREIDPDNEIFKNSIALAHSTFSSRHKGGPKRRNPHAAEGGMLSVLLLGANITHIPKLNIGTLVDLFSIIFTSIGHHHAPQIKQIHEFELNTKMTKVIEEVVQYYIQNQNYQTISLSNIPSQIFGEICRKDRYDFYMKYILRFNDQQKRILVPVYFYLVRNLRLSDFDSLS